MYASFPILYCGAVSASVSDFRAPVGTSEVVFTQHSKDFLGFVVRMSPFLHHPLILNLQHSACLSLCILRSWWKPASCSAGDHSLSLAYCPFARCLKFLQGILPILVVTRLTELCMNGPSPPQNTGGQQFSILRYGPILCPIILGRKREKSRLIKPWK